MRRKRFLFCRKIDTHLDQNREIIYTDETSMINWVACVKIWKSSNSTLPLVLFYLTKAMIEKCTIIWAISINLNYLITNITHSINKENVEYFFWLFDLHLAYKIRPL